ncbi:MAG: DUF3857 domain-containing protein [Proteobacteria bacterium]|nr:DUF3857 domain-containing protein [Pseudomonadota bacterium]
MLVDRQIRIDHGASLNYHFVTHVLNSSGVSSDSQLSVGFDPEKERLHLHSVTVHRDGQMIDQLKRGRIEILRRESGLEQGLIDGSLTFHLVMNDIRVGDVIDVQYTIDHVDAEWGNRFFTLEAANWADPVAVSRLLVRVPQGQGLKFQTPSGFAPETRTEGNWVIYAWNWQNIPAVAYEDGAPSWYPQFAWIELSQFDNWAAVANAATQLFVAKPLTPELHALSEKMRSAGTSDRDRLLSVIRFVQDDVRYTGVELGAGAYRPSDPATVLQRRWGDCKDKTMLTVTILRDLGIDAAPALVSTRYLRHAADRLPSPGIFNHAIVRARVGGFTYWLDPTVSDQGGDLDNVANARFGAALVVSAETSGLEQIPAYPPAEPLITSESVVDLTNGYDKPARYTITTTHRGSEADNTREELRGTTLEKVSKSYLNFYKQLYPGMRVTSPLRVQDDRAANVLRIDEAYELDNPLEASEDGKHRVLELRAELLTAKLNAPGTPVRKTPLGLSFPTNIEQRTRIRLPGPLPVEDHTRRIETPAFRWELRVSHTDREVQFDYRYQTLADSVPVEQLAEFLKQREAARVASFFTVTAPTTGDTPNPELTAAEEQLAAAANLVQTESWERADAAFKVLLQSNHLDELPEPKRHAAYFLGGLTAFAQKEPARAHGLLKTSSELPSATAHDWIYRWRSAVQSSDWPDAAYALSALARKWPDSTADLEVRGVGMTVAKNPKLNDARYELLKALADAKFSRPGVDYSAWWRDLGLLQIQRGERAAAIASLSQVTEPDALVSILADNRFAGVRDGLGSHLDIPSALHQEVEQARKQVADNPTKLEPISKLAMSLAGAIQAPEALQILDQAIATAADPPGRERYKDYDEQYVWLLNMRSQMLYLMGRWDEAVEQLRLASQMKEGASVNVSQVINLGVLLNRLQRPAEAREVVKQLGSGSMSPYGQMQKWDVELSAALQLGDSAEAARVLQLIHDHQDDAVSTYEDGLVMANRLDEAAALLISRLEDPDRRIPALMSLQHFDLNSPAAALPRPAELRRRWDLLESRADVRAALAKVGTAGTYPMVRVFGD